MLLISSSEDAPRASMLCRRCGDGGGYATRQASYKYDPAALPPFLQLIDLTIQDLVLLKQCQDR